MRSKHNKGLDVTQVMGKTNEDDRLFQMTEEDYRDLDREFRDMGYDDLNDTASEAAESGTVDKTTKLYGIPEGYDGYEKGTSNADEDVTFNYEDEVQEAAPEVDVENLAPAKKVNPFVRFGRWIKSWRLWVKILVLVVILAMVTGGVIAATAVKTVQEAVEVMNEDAEIPESYDLGLQPIDGYINILLLGVDTRDMKKIKGSRSDMIMIASINMETYDVTLTSLYRDTYLKLGSTSTYDKITHACYYGGPEMTIKSLNQALDLNIEQYAIVNFKAVADVVDAVGGITVDVQEEEIPELNKFTKYTAHNIGRKKSEYHLCEGPGEQTLCGVQAVSYGRIRKGVGDDYKRTERMRIVVNKVFEKMKAMSFKELKEVINVVIPQTKTNLKMNDILALGMDINKYSINKGKGFPYSVGGGMYNGVSYVWPRNLGADVVKLHQEVFGQEDYQLSSTAASISAEIASRYANRGSGSSDSSSDSGEKKKEEQKKNTSSNTSQDNSSSSSSSSSSS